MLSLSAGGARRRITLCGDTRGQFLCFDTPGRVDCFARDGLAFETCVCYTADIEVKSASGAENRILELHYSTSFPGSQDGFPGFFFLFL